MPKSYFGSDLFLSSSSQDQELDLILVDPFQLCIFFVSVISVKQSFCLISSKIVLTKICLWIEVLNIIAIFLWTVCIKPSF